MDDLLSLAVVFALIGANAFFVAGEYAVVTARRSMLNGKAEAGSGRARAALRLMDDPVRVISTVQVGITALGILTGAIAEPLVRELLGDEIPRWAAFVLAFATVTYLSVVIGELVPKALTLARAEWVLLMVARPVEMLAKILTPAVWLLQRSSALVLRPFGIRNVTAGDSISSPEELRAIVDDAESSGVIPEQQEALIHNVLDFADRSVLDVMVPAHEIVWLDVDSTVEQGLDRVIESPHSRYLVADGSLASLRGMVHVRELIAADRDGSAAALAEVVRPVHIVPETKLVGPLLEEMRAKNEQLAAIVDEYGSVAGIVTLEDMLEQLVGDIYDEYDSVDPGFVVADDGTIEALGSNTVAELATLTGEDLSGVDARTLSGAVFNQLGRAPLVGDSAEVGPFTIAVTAVEGVRITHVKITR